MQKLLISKVPSGYGDGKVKEILKDLYNSEFRFLITEPWLIHGFAELEPNSR